MNELELDDRQRRAVAWIAGGMSGPQAFRKAGFSKSYARKSSVILKRPLYVKALEEERAILREHAPYDAPAAVREIDRQIKGALSAKNPNFMAGAKLLELKCKIYGLVREKLEVATIDLVGALTRAEQRVLDITPRGALAPAVPSTAWQPAHWRPQVSGDPVAENPEAGVVDGQARN